jgi:hypothetical protein
MLWKRGEDGKEELSKKALKNLGLVTFIIISIYFVCQLIANSMLNYTFKNMVLRRYTNNTYQDRGKLYIGLFEWMLPVYLAQYILFFGIYYS